MNLYTTMVERLVSTLTTELGTLSWTPLVVEAGRWDPRILPEFERYYVKVSPPPRPWVERRISTKEIQYLLRADIVLLVKNFSEEGALFGDNLPTAGVFQFVSDVKDVLRATDLSGLLSRTYDETAGEVDVNTIGGFETGPRVWVHHARVPYTAAMEPFCFPPS